MRPFWDVIQWEVDALLADNSAQTIAVYFRDLKNGPWFGINENTTFTPSSLLKVPLMMDILKRAEHDASLLRKKIRYEGREDITQQQFFKPKETLRPGSWYTVDNLIFRMIAYSDNNATRLLDANNGLDRIRDFMAELNIPFDVRKTEECITVRDYSAFFRVLFNASYLNHDMSEKALNYLSRSTFEHGIRAGLPPGTTAATKFGEFSSTKDGVMEYQLSESGIVYYPDHPYLLGIVTKGPYHDSLPAVIAEISHAVYREVDRQHGKYFHVYGED